MRYRVDRLENEIQKQIGEIIIQDLNDPRLNGVTVTGVDLSHDLKNARVYYSFLGHLASTANKTQKGLVQAKKRIRYLLGKKLSIRQIPEIEFVHDGSFDYADKINQIINRIEGESEDNL
ncbi:30S ribosome-binding factor RbfA [Xylocopilactobacillus apicola]|uniref:Ribosome-binding factor A n=1 Tax=Xylocopilactobacillus apicola TaxID=2932184 RepID=A0AAU9D7I8_9LACO|nr:30S ribosome-binding factor RbfA [Xylocopilactobacillus apicola]BDR58346.1 ribosome-binding factor A [Xylocopilactobacillus apicola]